MNARSVQRRRESGSAKRRRKAIQRRQWVLDMDVRHAIANDRFPTHMLAGDICPCGRRSWILQGATEEELAAYYEDARDHDDYCDALVSA